MSKGGQVEETPQQKAMAEHAVNLMQDYKQRWLPVQQKLISQVEATGADNSAARKEATGKANVDTQMQFGGAEGALEKSLSNSGAQVGSGKANLAIGGMGADAAKSKGMGGMIADQQVTDAYTQGLGAIMAIGQGKQATVANSMASQARQSGYQAEADANASLRSQQGTAGLVGQVAGYGLQSGIGSGLFSGGSGMSTNNAGGYVGAAPGTGYGGMGGGGLPTAGGR